MFLSKCTAAAENWLGASGIASEVKKRLPAFMRQALWYRDFVQAQQADLEVAWRVSV